MASSLSIDDQTPNNPVKVPEISTTVTEPPAVEASGKNVKISDTKDVVKRSASSQKKKAMKINDSALAIILQKLIQAVPRTAPVTVYRDSLSLPKSPLRDIRRERGKFRLQKIPPSIEEEVDSLVEGLPNVSETETAAEVVSATEEEESSDVDSSETEDGSVEADDNDQNYALPVPQALLVMVYVNENMHFDFSDAFNTVNIFPENYPNWNSLAHAVLFYWLAMHGPNLPPHPALQNATPANCWPGHVTCFGRVNVIGGQGVTFDRYNWTEYDDFVDARNNINALAVIRM